MMMVIMMEIMITNCMQLLSHITGVFDFGSVALFFTPKQ